MDGELEGLICEAERRAEHLIALCRILVAVSLGVILYFAVVGRAQTWEILASPQLVFAWVTLGCYALIGALSHFLSEPSRFRRWYAYVFVLFDTAFVAISLHLALKNTHLTTGYVAALPTAWLIPVIIAFGAMRYSVRLQVLTAVLLILGIIWAGAPTLTQDTDASLVRSIQGMFSHTANEMRLAMLIVACSVIALASSRTRRLLHMAIEQGRRRRSLTKFLPPKVASIIESRDSGEVRRGRRQHVVILFVDIRDFTRRTEAMAPEAVSAFLARYRAELRRASERLDGIIDKFVGDGAMIVFGVPSPQPTDAALAIACARDICARMADWSKEMIAANEPPLRVGVGIHAGEAFVGAVGDDERLEFTVVGDTVNVAARVEEMSRTLKADIVATEPVLREAGVAVAEWTEQGTVAIRGRSEPMTLYSLGGAAAACVPEALTEAR
ncbi:adenylate/guanylate cyclase domain-containing protein [Acuticoccus kandeliae]|uniref:adenylate/guanylate cyclase domain-containing protein n=1 Tax=Acuticoccus kandeliae TaxID=2073160 RepID=UPI000D3EC733|nr:adenylate/guanylate cyclase domain-containing protein [Acuticoccus kandeliae]